MTSAITWGPEIAVAGQFPDWLSGGDQILRRYNDGSSYGGSEKASDVLWEGLDFIRLPANHPHYAAAEAPTAPSGGEVGPEVLVLTKAHQAMLRTVLQRVYDAYGSEQPEADELFALLPEPVDAVHELAAKIVADASNGLISREQRIKTIADSIRALAAGDRS